MLVKRDKYYILYTFLYADCDLVEYLTSRECTDLDNMIDYAYHLANRLEEKFGECISIEIYKNMYTSETLVYVTTF